MFTIDLPGGNLRRKMKRRDQLKIWRFSVITPIITHTECEDIMSPNFELCSHLHFAFNRF